MGKIILAIVWAFFIGVWIYTGSLNEIWIFGAILLAATTAIGIDRFISWKKYRD